MSFNTGIGFGISAIALAKILNTGSGTGGNAIVFENSGFESTFNTTTLTGNRVIDLPDKSGTVAMTSDIITIYNTNSSLTGNRIVDLGAFNLDFNLSSTGAFAIQDGGIDVFTVNSSGNVNIQNNELYFGGSKSFSITGSQSILIGKSSTTSSANSITIGYSANTVGQYAIAIGDESYSDNNGIALGRRSVAFSNSVAIGSESSASSNEFVVGSTNSEINNFYLGEGKNTSTTSILTFQNSNIKDTLNTSSGNFIIQSGTSTGNTYGGDLIFNISQAGISGTSQNTQVNLFTLKGDGNSHFQNTKLGINVTTPTYTFEVQSTSTTDVMLLKDQLGAEVFSVADNGNVNIENNELYFGGSSFLYVDATNFLRIGKNTGTSASIGGLDTSIYIGNNTGNTMVNQDNNIFIGNKSADEINTPDNTIIGNLSVRGGGGQELTAIGNRISSSGSFFQSTVIGETGTLNNAIRSVAIGGRFNLSHSRSIILGHDVLSTATNQFVVGSIDAQITTAYIGYGVQHSVGGTLSIQNNDITTGTTNISSGALTLQSGKSTGNAVGGNMLFNISQAGASGTAQNTQVNILTLKGDGNSFFQNTRLGIGTSSPNTSSILDLTSTTGALLLPRLTTAQRDSLTATEGMILGNSTTNHTEYYNGTSWVKLNGEKVNSQTSTATLTVNSDTTDIEIVTAQAEAISIANPTGTPTQGQKLIYRLKDNGTARAITWNAIFRAIGVTLPTTTTISKTIYVGFIYNSTDTKWDCVAVNEEA